VRAGLAESIAHGVTLVGDIAGGGLSYPILANAPIRSVVFHEVLGLPAVRAGQAWAAFLDWLCRSPGTPPSPGRLRPHAPYNRRASLYRASARLAPARGLPLTTHLAETRDEVELLEHRRGPLLDFLTSLGVWDEAGLVGSFAEVLDTLAGVPA